MTKRSVLQIAGVLGVAASAALLWENSRSAGLSGEELDICEATVRWQVAEFHGGGLRAIFVNVGGKTPRNAFISRFEGVTPPVRPGRAKGGGPNAEVSIGEIRVQRDGTAQVACSYMVVGDERVSPDVGAGVVLTLRRDGDHWIVMDVRRVWVAKAYHERPACYPAASVSDRSRITPDERSLLRTHGKTPLFIGA